MAATPVGTIQPAKSIWPDHTRCTNANAPNARIRIFRATSNFRSRSAWISRLNRNTSRTR